MSDIQSTTVARERDAAIERARELAAIVVTAEKAGSKCIADEARKRLRAAEEEVGRWARSSP